MSDSLLGGHWTAVQLSQMIGTIYQDILEKTPWKNTLDILRVEINANYASMILRQPSEGSTGFIIASSEIDTSIGSQSYMKHFYTLDPFVNLPRDQAITSNELVGLDSWLNSDFYKLYLKPYNIMHIMGADVVSQDGSEIRIRFCRTPEAGAFLEKDKSILNYLLPHIRRAAHIQSQLELISSERQLYSNTIDRLFVGTMILDEDGFVLDKNTVADEILDERDGIRIIEGRLHANFPAENRQLHELLQQAIEEQHAKSPSIVKCQSITRPSGKPNLGILIKSIPASQWSESKHKPTIAVFIRDPERKLLGSHELVRKMYGLTQAEATLSLHLAAGYSLDEAAELMNIRRNTARAHLRSIFSKTNVTRQTSLVHMILNSVVSLA